MDDIIFQIQTHLKKYKAYCACERDLEMLNNEEPELNFNQKKRLEEMRKNKSMIENWLSILSDEERCIIQLHLIDGKSWKRIEAEYEQKRRDDTRCTYIHIEQIAFDFSAEDYADERDRVTAGYELGERILKRRAAKDSRVRRLQKRLACFGYDAGEPDGVFGAQTEAAVRGFQKISGAQFGLKVDGIVGDQTKEALTYPRKWLL